MKGVGLDEKGGAVNLLDLSSQKKKQMNRPIITSGEKGKYAAWGKKVNEAGARVERGAQERGRGAEPSG